MCIRRGGRQEMMGVKGVGEIRQVKLVGNIATRLAS